VDLLEEEPSGEEVHPLGVEEMQAIEEEKEAAQKLQEIQQLEEQKAALEKKLAEQERQQQEARTKQKEEEIKALQAQLEAQRLETQRLQQLAEEERQRAAAQQTLIFGYTSERVEHNINKETERAIQGVSNLLSGKKWGHGRKKHKRK
jgi:hypothetical protein